MISSNLRPSGSSPRGTSPRRGRSMSPSRERLVQKSYWESHTLGAATVESMMLDSKASVIDLEERPEVSP